MPGKGKEMRQLTLAVSASVLVLVLAIIGYFLADTVISTNRNISDNKQKVIEESVRTLQEMREAIIITQFSPEFLELFNPDLIRTLLAGEVSTIYKYAIKIILLFYPIEYVGFVTEDRVVEYGTRTGLDVDPEELPIIPPEEDYVILDHLGEREGFFVSVFFPSDIPLPGFETGKLRTNMVVDRTEEIAGVEKYFRDQRNSILLRLSIAAFLSVILSLFLTTTGLRYFTRKYVVSPIERLNRQAQEIVDGTFEGEVEVEEDSAFAALQGLLRSGQKVLRSLDERLRE